MKFIIDENMIPRFAKILKQLGFEARHVYDVNLETTPDEDIIEFALKTGETIITNDLDFSRILALSQREKPTIITFRFPGLNPEIFQEIVQLNFSQLESAVDEGSLITIDERGIRIKKLPVFKHSTRY